MSAVPTWSTSKKPLKFNNIHTVVMHVRPHLDELLAFFLAGCYGYDIFHGIIDAKIEFWGTGILLPGGKTADELEKEGYLLIGIGGGRFDEHKEGGRNGKCAASLMAEFLGISHYPEIKRLIEYAQQSDAFGDKDKFAFASIIKTAQRNHKDPKEVVDWVYDILADYMDCMLGKNIAVQPGPDLNDIIFGYLDSEKIDLSSQGNPEDLIGTLLEISKVRPEYRLLAQYMGSLSSRSEDTFDLLTMVEWIRRTRPDEVVEEMEIYLNAYMAEQYDFHYHAETEIKNFGTWYNFDSKIGRIKALVVQSDLQAVNAYARWRHRAGLIVQQNSTGNVQIYTNRKNRVDLRDIMAILRVEEMSCKGGSLGETPDWDYIRQEGSIEEVPNWYFENRPGWILNGSLSHPGVEPTRINLERLVRLIRLGLKPDPCREKGCPNGNCQLWQYGLSFCRKRRWQIHNDQNNAD
ncbi:MAG: hypothetical protein GF349_01375 [Candidatus Magasanikbacteria bacterium]|nr:hypothetical protein [Candidatus Magasanikbacteria bacterium]